MKGPVISFLICVSLLLSMGGCAKNPVRAKLAEIESYAASSPDSARTALGSMDRSLLNTQKLRAEHALMLSTALSRCGIKATNDSLINIAVDYFGHYGPKEKLFLSYYYQGRAYQDCEEYESAMKSYLKAEHINAKAVSMRHLTSLHLKKGELYQHYYDCDKAVASFRKAQDLALKCDWRDNYFNAMAGELAQYIVFDRKDEADSMINVLTPFRNEMTLKNRMVFDNRILMASWDNVDKDKLFFQAREFEEKYSSINSFRWDFLSVCYSKAGALSHAERTLNLYKEQLDNPESDLRYLSAYSELLSSSGFERESKEVKLALEEGLREQVYEKGKSDLRFLEERMAREQKVKNMNAYLAAGAIFLLLLCSISFLELRRRRLQKEHVSRLYDSLKTEYEETKDLLLNNSNIQEEARVLLGQRVTSLASFLSTEPPSSLDRVADQLDSLTNNRKELLETIGLLYAVYYPSFVNRLSDFGLSNAEIGYCCLLMLGFRTREIGDVINRSSTYHVSSTIRQKIGLGPNDTNLSIFLKNLFKTTTA